VKKQGLNHSFVGIDQVDLARVICTRLFLVVKAKVDLLVCRKDQSDLAKSKSYSFV
jgi:hypothetical protein